MLAFSVYGCGQINEKEIKGVWQITAFSANTPSLAPGVINLARVEALSSVYTFESDSTFHMTSDYTSQGEGGTWRINADKVLIMNYISEGEQSEETYQILSLNDNSMKWKQDIEGLGSISMTLKKK